MIKFVGRRREQNEVSRGLQFPGFGGDDGEIFCSLVYGLLLFFFRGAKQPRNHLRLGVRVKQEALQD